MVSYNNIITLNKNDRGIWDLDPSKGCTSGMAKNKNGCYGDCYAARSARIYGKDFSKTILRDFKNRTHQAQIIRQINKIDMPFIRMGCSGDPSENWQHTLHILSKIKSVNKEIVIITKHWHTLSDLQLSELSTYNVCINTSVSALDESGQLEKCLSQYERLKGYCKSILRVVTCDFNKSNVDGLLYSIIQENLLTHDGIIDTVFRPSKTNPLVESGIVNVKRMRFMNGMQLISKYNKKAYVGNCHNCIEKCGVYKDDFRRKHILQQQEIF